MNIIWTKHSQERQKEWEKKMGITKLEVEGLIENPEQIVPGDMGVLVAQTANRNGLLRSLFIETGVGRKIIRVYWTSKVKKYWKEQEDGNKV
ncbi:MAG: hypothetical protein HY730_08440 [Candidatus Tectomicrobia bacterium]|uniref:DUF4258 domain-containing protein n=1 Tax=Tectimicrobiota bacterium TaxID=2528274 RepID=A0A933LRI8_UNCTE|nr:hypothetical protein [Candidatus Tectomicrobia bacterium]